MISTYEERLEQFRRREIERTRRAGLSAYILNDDGSVLRISPDGTKDLIVVRLGQRHVEPVTCAGAGR
jgi:hypothetical protein